VLPDLAEILVYVNVLRASVARDKSIELLARRTAQVVVQR